MVELIVVIGIIALMAAVALPQITAMWQGSGFADAENRIRGLLMSARARAMYAKEAGLFFYVEDETQKAVFIVAEPNGAAAQTDTADRYRVTDDGVYQFPKPIRIVPRAVFDTIPGPPPQAYVWTDAELANEDVQNLALDARNHRNFFTVVFSPAGRMLTDHVVLIHDPPPPPPAPQNQGGMTGLPIAPAATYQDEIGGQGPLFIALLPDMVSVAGLPVVAINFPTVDGLLVYDDSVFTQFADADKRQHLIDTVRPTYISRQTGAVIRGPSGENAP